MTDIDTKELRRLMEEATPGPWTTCHNGHYWEIGTEADAWFGQQIGDMCASEHMYRSPRDGDFEDHSEANAALIVAMHNALPALLSEAEEAARLREALTKIKSLLSYDQQDNVSAAAAQSNINSAWWQAHNALTTGGDDARD